MPSWCAIFEFLKDWQTLLGAVLALFAAGYTIKTMQKQIKQEDNRNKERMARKAMAARSYMPDALSALSKYARDCGSYLTERSETPPTPPTEAISALKQAIEHIDTDAAARVFRLISWYQVQRARTADGMRTEQIFEDHAYDIVLLQAYTNSLFDYARNETQTIEGTKPTQAEMRTAKSNVFELINIAKNPDNFRNLDEIIARRHSNGASS